MGKIVCETHVVSRIPVSSKVRTEHPPVRRFTREDRNGGGGGGGGDSKTKKKVVSVNAYGGRV